MPWRPPAHSAVLVTLAVLVLAQPFSATHARPLGQLDPNLVIQITSPPAGERLRDRVDVTGYAVDRRSPAGSGLNERDIQVYLDDYGDLRNLLDYALAGIDSPAAAATLGPQFDHAGFRLPWNTCTAGPGRHSLIVWVSSLVTLGARNTAAVDVELQPCTSARPSGWQARNNLASAQYQAAFDELRGQGYRTVAVDGYTVNNQASFAAIWEQGGGPAWQAHHNLTSEQYQALVDQRAADGYRLKVVSGYTVDDEPRFAAIWERIGGPPQQARHNLTSAQYQAAYDELTAQGYRLVLVNGYTVNNEPRFAAIWEQLSGPAWRARHNMTADQYQATFDELTAQGYRPRVVSGYTVNSEPRFAAIWEQVGGPPFQARHNLTSNQYQATFDDLTAQGYRLKVVSGYAVNNEPRFATIWEQS